MDVNLIIGYICGIGYAGVCLVLSLVLYKLGVPKNITRKIVHILVGFEWFILYHFFGAGLHFLAVCIFFLLLLALAYWKNLMPMISSDGDNAPGTVYYAVAMTGVAIVGLFVPDVMVPFGIGIMCTSIGDGLAGVVGQSIKKSNPKIYGNKSLFGSVANLVFSFLSALILSEIYSLGLGIPHCIAIALLAVELELFTGYGLDNITITWGVTALTYSFVHFHPVTNYILPILLSLPVIAFAVKKRALTAYGVIGAIFMDLIISLALGNFGFMILISFFLIAILVDKIKRRAKHKEEAEKGDRRDLVQVIANGLVGTALACAFVFSGGNPIFAVGFVASFAEALGDTVASGIGIFSKNTFDLFKVRKCEKGISGGMSWIGTFSSLVASFLIGFIAFGMSGGAFGLREVLIVGISGFLGVVFDSFLGSVFQVKYRCPVCGKITEKSVHCDTETVKHSGFKSIDNDVVNLSSGVFAAAVAIIASILIV